MNKLFKAELKRRLFSFLFLGEIIAIIGFNYNHILWHTYGFKVSADFFLFQNFKYLCIFIGLNSCLQIGQEFENHTINNKLFLGFSKSVFYKYETIIGVIEAVILFFVDILSVMVMSSMQKYTPLILNFKLLINSFTIIITLTVVSFLSTALAIIIKYRIPSVLIIICLTIFLFNAGESSSRSLMQPKQTTCFSLEGKLEDNPLYVSGKTRTLHNLHVNISPYGQAAYASYYPTETIKEKQGNSLYLKRNSWHLEFILTDILELIIIYAVGLYVLKRRDLN